jgi:HSP20 family protein
MTTLIRFREPFRDLASFHTEMNRVFGGLLEGDGRTNQSWSPSVDVWENENELVYAFDLPGIDRDKISVELEDNSLTVTAERERSEETGDDRFYRFERRFGTFTRTIALPQGVSEDSIKADYKDGVLDVRVAKPEQPKPHRIEIGGSSETQTIEGSASKA